MAWHPETALLPPHGPGREGGGKKEMPRNELQFISGDKSEAVQIDGKPVQFVLG